MKRLLLLVLCVSIVVGGAALTAVLPEGGEPAGGGGTTTVTTASPTLQDITQMLDGMVTTTTTGDGWMQVEMTTAVPVIPTVTEGKPTTTGAYIPMMPVVPTSPQVTRTAPVPTAPSTTRRPSATSSVATTAPTTTGTATTTGATTTGATTTEATKTTAATATTVTTVTTTTKATCSTYGYTQGQTHTAVPITERYIYSLLDGEQQEQYRKIDRAVRNLEAEVDLGNIPETDRWYYIYYMYMMDNPEHFYLCSTCTLYNYGEGKKIVFSYSVGELYCRYGTSQPEIDGELRAAIREKKAVFDAEVQRILRTIPANAPAVEKERLLYDRILLDSHYNLGARWDGLAEDNWTAYGVLVNKYGVCESYAEAFQTLCLAAGINCTGVVGSAGGGHKWNAVELDGEWYVCDITFDDPIGGDPNDAYHHYFNRTTAEMEAMGHSTEYSDFPGPVCTGTKYGCENYYGRSRWE